MTGLRNKVAPLYSPLRKTVNRNLWRTGKPSDSSRPANLRVAPVPLLLLFTLGIASFAAAGPVHKAVRGLPWIERRGDAADLVEATLRLSAPKLKRSERRRVLAEVDTLSTEVMASIDEDAGPRERLSALSNVIFKGNSFRGTMALADPRSLSLLSLLETKQGTCVSLVILYLSVAERVGLTLHAAATPVHLFVRYEGPGGVINIETLEQGRMVEDAEYRRRYRMADSSIERGLFLRPLSKKAVLAHYLSNRGAIASKEGRREDAVRDFDTALELYPDLEAAYYNRGLEHLKAEDFETARADLTKAIELHPLDAQAFNNRGLADLKLADTEAARRDFQEAIRIDPGQREAKENLKLLGLSELSPSQAP